MSKKIFATAWHPGSANSLVPVLKELKNKGFNLEVVAKEFASNTFTSQGVPHITYQGLGMGEVTPNSIYTYFKQHNYQPDLVLTGSSSLRPEEWTFTPEQSAIKAGKLLSIPRLSILDFWDNYIARFFENGSTSSSPDLMPTKIAIPDEFALEDMVKLGFPRDKLETTGNPHYDQFVQASNSLSSEEVTKIKQELRFDPTSRLIVFASQPISAHKGLPEELGYDQTDSLRELLFGVSNLPRINDQSTSVLVTAHPKERREILSKLYKTVTDFPTLDVAVESTYPTQRAILASDLVVSPFSTVLIEATYMGKPAISLQPGLTGKDRLEVTNSRGITIPVNKPGDIGEELLRVFFDAEYRLSISEKRSKLGNDGKATERVVSLIESLI